MTTANPNVKKYNNERLMALLRHKRQAAEEIGS